jgi:hypothetical protein
MLHKINEELRGAGLVQMSPYSGYSGRWFLSDEELLVAVNTVESEGEYSEIGDFE